MSSSNEFRQLQSFLKDMFQFNEHDLDFGIYRITRLKRQFIENFIDGEGEDSLRAVVAQALGNVQNTQVKTSENWLSAFSAQFGPKGEPKWKAVKNDPQNQQAIDQLKKLFELSEEEKDQAEQHLKIWLESKQLDSGSLEAKVYNHLLNFFELYYQNGDFGYNTRAASAFKVPYEADYDGSDTLFHWKHKDSYYIKTGNGFHSVRFEVDGGDHGKRWIEFRLTQGSDDGAQTGEHNNNKETQIKLYQFTGVQALEEANKTIWQVLFKLADSATSKTELYPKIWHDIFGEIDLTPYLHKKPGKNESAPGNPIFNDLKEDFDKTDGGQIKGMAQLRLKLDKYIEELAKRNEFADLGNNAAQRAEALTANPIANALYQIDKNLNKFYVGNDADYFIHKDLLGFLNREKSRFIKQVIFSDLESLLNAGQDNITALIANTFNQVADKLIGFLAAIENFQKGLFELKKKIVDTHYLISVGKVPAEFYPRLLDNLTQVGEWRETFNVAINAPEQLAEHPTLVVDTSYFVEIDSKTGVAKNPFQDDLLSHPAFDNLDEQCDGLLINSENWQALNLLQDKFRAQIKTIYIDPPYNTGGDGFLYKDSFKHSSWTSMIYQGLVLAKNLLNSYGLLFSSIDTNEKTNLQSISNIIFLGSPTLEIVRATGTPTAQGTTGLSNTYDSLLVSTKAEKAHLYGLPLSEEDKRIYNQEDEKGKYLTRSLRMTGEEDRREDRPDMYYGVESPDGSLVYPLGPGGYESRWRLKKEEYKSRLEKGLIEWKISSELDEKTDDLEDVCINAAWRPYIKFYLPETKTVQNIWNDVEGNKKGKRDLKNVLGYVKRLTPKPIGLIARIVEIGSLPGDFILDYFAGTGTTACAVMRVNKRNPTEARRKWLLCECSNIIKVAKNRIKRLLFSENWKAGAPKDKGDSGTLGIVKLQVSEQYEDLLDNLQAVWDEENLPCQIPVKYLFRPEQQSLIATLDLGRPFANTIKIGKDRKTATIDLIETWCYLQGYWIKSRRLYRKGHDVSGRVMDRDYLALETTHGTLVLLRDIAIGEDDTHQIQAIIDLYQDEKCVSRIERLELNLDADLRKLGLPTTLIQAHDFMRGVQWS